MSDHDHELEAFVSRVVQQLAKNGYPERKVAFPIERMYEAAYAKGLNFNDVVDVLTERGIGHEKTPEKIIFGAPEPAPQVPELEGLAGFDATQLAGLSKEDLLAQASAAMAQLGPEQLAAIRAMVEGMTPEQQAAMIEQARKLGLA